MPIDDFDIAALKTRLFQEIGESGSHEPGFTSPSEALVQEHVTLDMLLEGEVSLILAVAKVFDAEAMPDLAEIASELHDFLQENDDDLRRHAQPDYRVLEYVYPIV